MRTAPDGTRSVTLRRTSPDGENGFPGTLDVAVTYAVRGAELAIEHTATTDAPTVVSLTNHAYCEPDGARRRRREPRVRIPARRYLPVDKRLVPTGELAPVDGTPFDLGTPTRIGRAAAGRPPPTARARGIRPHVRAATDRGPLAQAA